VDDFIADWYQELSKFGEITDIAVCDSDGDHLKGNVFVLFVEEQDAAKAVQSVTGRYYDGVVVQGELSTVQDLAEGECRMHLERTCSRGRYCGFLHCFRASRKLSDFQ